MKVEQCLVAAAATAASPAKPSAERGSDPGARSGSSVDCMNAANKDHKDCFFVGVDACARVSSTLRFIHDRGSRRTFRGGTMEGALIVEVAELPDMAPEAAGADLEVVAEGPAVVREAVDPEVAVRRAAEAATKARNLSVSEPAHSLALDGANSQVGTGRYLAGAAIFLRHVSRRGELKRMLYVPLAGPSMLGAAFLMSGLRVRGRRDLPNEPSRRAARRRALGDSDGIQDQQKAPPLSGQEASAKVTIRVDEEQRKRKARQGPGQARQRSRVEQARVAAQQLAANSLNAANAERTHVPQGHQPGGRAVSYRGPGVSSLPMRTRFAAADGEQLTSLASSVGHENVNANFIQVRNVQGVLLQDEHGCELSTLEASSKRPHLMPYSADAPPGHSSAGFFLEQKDG